MCKNVSSPRFSFSVWAFVRLAMAGVLLLQASAFAKAESGESSDSASREGCSAGQSGCVPVGRWSFKLGAGLGIRDNPLVDQEDIPLFLIPDVSYYGERFFFDTYTGGLSFVETEQSMINAIVTISFDQIYFRSRSLGNFSLESGPLSYEVNNYDDSSVSSTADSTVDGVRVGLDGQTFDAESNEPVDTNETIVLERLHSRDTALLGGLDIAYFPGRWDMSLQVLTDVSGVHNGSESRFSVSRFVRLGEEHFELAAGTVWQDQKTMDYYWGVYESEVENPALAYRPSSGFSPFVRIDWRRRLSGNWSLQSTVHHKWLSGEISNSPLVEEDTVLTVFLGGVYHF